MASAHPCPSCRRPGLRWIAQYARWFCDHCRRYAAPLAPPPGPAVATMPAPGSGIWFQNSYRIRKKVLAIAQQYWIEDQRGAVLGYSKAKILVLREDIRVYTDESMRQELFRLRQQQIMDAWATFAVIESASNRMLGFIRRKFLESTFLADEWEVLDAWNRKVGEILEDSGRGLARKYVPFGELVPEHMTMTLNGVPVARIEQEFKIIGDIWDLHCLNVYGHVDRRVLLGGLLLMAMIEGRRK